MLSTYLANIDGEEVKIIATGHAQQRMEVRHVKMLSVCELIEKKAGEMILELRDGDDFAVINYAEGYTIVASVDVVDYQINVTLITVIDKAKFVHIKEGQTIFEVRK